MVGPGHRCCRFGAAARIPRPRRIRRVHSGSGPRDSDRRRLGGDGHTCGMSQGPSKHGRLEHRGLRIERPRDLRGKGASGPAPSLG